MALLSTFVAISMLESANCLAVVGLYAMLARRHIQMHQVETVVKSKNTVFVHALGGVNV